MCGRSFMEFNSTTLVEIGNSQEGENDDNPDTEAGLNKH
jgi:hypothetical protein